MALIHTHPEAMPSLHKGDYYTKEEYEQLRGLLSHQSTFRNLLLLKALDEDDLPSIHRAISRIDAPHKYSAWKIIYDTALDQIPLLMDIEPIKTICMWRLQINK